MIIGIKSNSNLPIEQSSLPSMLKDNPRTKWYTSNIVNNNTLQRAKVAYLTYKKTLIRQ